MIHHHHHRPRSLPVIALVALLALVLPTTRANAAPDPASDTYATARIDATRKTLQALNHPFRSRLIFSDTPIQVTLNMVVGHLAETVTTASKTDDLTLAHRAEQSARIVLSKWESIAASNSAHRSIAGARSNLLAHVSISGTAIHPDTLSEESAANRTTFNSFGDINPWSHIAMIPIPTISNLAIEQLLSPQAP